MHRREVESIVVRSNAKTQQWGLGCGFAIAISAVSGGIWLSLRGMSGAGLAAIIGALVALVAVFIYGKAGQRKELRGKEYEVMRASPGLGESPRQ